MKKSLLKKKGIRRGYKFIPKCPETGKQKYPSEKEANHAITFMWATTGMSMDEFEDLHSWKCETCSAWHIGHKKYFTQDKENKDNKENREEKKENETVTTLGDAVKVDIHHEASQSPAR